MRTFKTKTTAVCFYLRSSARLISQPTNTRPPILPPTHPPTYITNQPNNHSTSQPTVARRTLPWITTDKSIAAHHKLPGEKNTPKSQLTHPSPASSSSSPPTISPLATRASKCLPMTNEIPSNIRLALHRKRQRLRRNKDTERAVSGSTKITHGTR